MKTTGYSGTPLVKKLGFKEGFRVRIINQPDYYFELFEGLPETLDIRTEKKSKKNLIHYFSTQAKKLEQDISLLKSEIVPDGMIWISWPKKSAKVTTDITEDVIRDIALHNGLVDVKVCAVDNVWSGLKLVIPVKDRKYK